MEPVPVVKIILHPNANLPTIAEYLVTLKSSIDQIYIAKITKNPEYKKIFHANIDLKLYVVIATISLSGLPRSNTSIIKPAIRKAIANKADNGASGLYNFLLNADDNDAMLSTPEAMTIRVTAKI